MRDEREASVQRLIEAVASAPIEAWHQAALKARQANEALPDVGALWQAADLSDAVLAWHLADNIETLYYRLNSPAVVKSIGGKEACELIRRATELALLSVAFPDLLEPEVVTRVVQPFQELRHTIAFRLS